MDATGAGAPSTEITAGADTGILPTGETSSDGGVEESWLDSLPESHRENSNISKYKSQEDFLEGHLNLVKKIGEKGLERPGEDATDEERNAFYSKIGRPENAGDYSWESLNEEGESDFDFDPDALSSAQEQLHAAGLTNDQYKVVMDLHKGQVMQGMADMDRYQQEQANQTTSNLQKEWGDKFDTKIAVVQKAIDKFGMGETIRDLGLGNNEQVIRMFSELSDKMGESNMTGDTSSSGGGFDQQLKAITSSKAYNDKTHPDHHKMKQARTDLYAKRYNN